MDIQELQELAEKVYKENSKSAILDGIEGKDYISTDDTKTIKILDNSSLTLADYSCGYGLLKLDGIDWTFTNQRGRRIELSFTKSVNEKIVETFVKRAIVPEIDAYRFAYISSYGKKEEDAEKSVKMLLNQNVSPHNMLLFMNFNFAAEHILCDKVFVPTPRFYNSIDLFDGVSENEKQGGYARHKKCLYNNNDNNGKELNYILLDINSLFTVAKFELKLDNDGLMSFLVYHDVFIKNKDNIFVGV